MVAKMKYISISGHISGMNHVVSRYLSRYDIQLQEARHNMMEPFTTLNPYAQTLQKARQLAEIVGAPPLFYIPPTEADAVNMVETAFTAYENRDKRLRELEEQIATAKKQLEALTRYNAQEIDLNALTNSEFIHHRFGKFTDAQYRKFAKYFADDKRIIFHVARRDKEEVYGVFFTPMPLKDEIDAIFSSFDFTPEELRNVSQNALSEWEDEAAALTIKTFHNTPLERLAIACYKVKLLYASYDIKKYAAISRGRKIFTFSGWISADDSATMEQEIASDDLVFFHEGESTAKPPIILKNLPFIRRFEFFTQLYGLPEYNEIDPTPVLAITYTLLFGLMFGDIGHGAVLAIVGVFVQKRFHKNLGGIMTVVGISAAIFGILYGSVFGFEFSPIWRRPTENISETLIFAVVLGAGLIAFSMLLNMYNALRKGSVADFLFGTNGLAGLTLYATLLWVLVRVFVQGLPITIYVVAVVVLPLVLVFFRNPNPAHFFETLLGYATNTVSFVRVGAFAVSHAGMMHVVLQLGQGASGSRNFLILILGNILVLGIEGLLVGIQVLRLDFYEIFGRFYAGTGRAFSSQKLEVRGWRLEKTPDSIEKELV